MYGWKKSSSTKGFGGFFSTILISENLSEKENYGIIESSNECNSKEQITNQTEANQRRIYENSSKFFCAGAVCCFFRFTRGLLHQNLNTEIQRITGNGYLKNMPIAC